ncbi:MAG: type III-B CRISPR-associated protein Cas10/Cmr2 [Sulfuricurvum sp.]
MNTYIGLTIGPIYETLSSARKTRELWGASALFSYMMREMILRLQQEGALFIVPDLSRFRLDARCGVGVFHDRFICTQTTLEKVREIQSSVVSEIAETVGKNAEAKEWLKSYIQCSIAEAELDDANVILGMGEILDTLELHTKIPVPESSNPLQTFLRERLSGSFLTKAFLPTQKISFDSLPEIAARDVLNAMNDDTVIDDFESIRNHPSFKQPHSYIAIVHADGDNFGTYIKSLDSIESQQQFSRRIFEYSTRIVDVVSAHGGAAIFAGGDDLLAFLPVVFNNQTFFDAVKSIDELFDSYFSDTGATLSYGFSVTYHKFPLYEALEKSRNALYTSKSKGKNAITVSAQKHSGQSFELTIPKNNPEWTEAFASLLKSVVTEKTDLPHSIHHKLDLYKHLLNAIGHDQERLHAFMENNFNEEIHKNRFSAGLKHIQQIILAIYNDPSVAKNQKFDQLFAALSMIKLLRGDR